MESSLGWLDREFGRAPLLALPARPAELIPAGYSGGLQEARTLVDLLCWRMGVDPVRVELELHSQPAPLGHHRLRGGNSVIGVGFAHAATPDALVATIAHELGHVLLVGDERLDPADPDVEALADLVTVWYGLGVFGAGAAVRCARRRPGLTLPRYSYALAHYAWLRGETDPVWLSDLRQVPRAQVRRGLRHLAQRAGSQPAAHSL
ncbi:hypothetical protein [Catellatospora tritici]|uniref:hypothetical protein n=1 Tax=Catellatospora tritici TaxID=2851566 RepID=UPI001C2D9E23|nr:hypothetical protein [Catellatospora tritici]MBV1850246.1 hypothetical protein [Catellatospora tritici]